MFADLGYQGKALQRLEFRVLSGGQNYFWHQKSPRYPVIWCLSGKCAQAGPPLQGVSARCGRDAKVGARRANGQSILLPVSRGVPAPNSREKLAEWDRSCGEERQQAESARRLAESNVGETRTPAKWLQEAGYSRRFPELVRRARTSWRRG